MISWCSVTNRGQLISFVGRYLRCMFLLQAFHEWCGTAWYGTCGSFHSAHCGHGNGLLVTWYSDDFTWTWPPPHACMVLWSAYSGFAREVRVQLWAWGYVLQNINAIVFWRKFALLCFTPLVPQLNSKFLPDASPSLTLADLHIMEILLPPFLIQVGCLLDSWAYSATNSNGTNLL